MSHDHEHAGGSEPGPVADASVRTGRTTDAPAMGLVQAVAWRQRYAGLLPEGVVEQFDGSRFAALWRSALQHPPSALHRVLVACAGTQVVGFAAIGPAQEPDSDRASEPQQGQVGELMELVVHPDARGTGHGSRLLNAAADTLRAGDLAEVVAWLPARDEQARAFLTRAGLGPDGAWRDHVVGPEGQTLRQVRVRASL